jgi:hypothetical protein
VNVKLALVEALGFGGEPVIVGVAGAGAASAIAAAPRRAASTAAASVALIAVLRIRVPVRMLFRVPRLLRRW